MRFLLFYILLLISPQVIPQNLVVNGSFEPDSVFTASHSYGAMGKAGRSFINGWIVPTQASPDYYNSDESTIGGRPVPKARTGQGRAGLILAYGRNAYKDESYKEYIEGHLVNPLEKGVNYTFEFYMVPYRIMNYRADTISVYFTRGKVTRETKFFLDTDPQLSFPVSCEPAASGWQKYCGTFTAQGGEYYFTIGNFSSSFQKPSSHCRMKKEKRSVHMEDCAYYFIDDVYLTWEEKGNCEKTVKRQNWYLLLDASQSMSEGEKWNEVNHALFEIATDEAQHLPAVISFGNKSQLIISPGTNDTLKWKTILQQVKPGGTTRINTALEILYSSIRKDTTSSASFAAIITDGAFKPDADTRKYMELLKDWGVIVFFFTTGKQIPQQLTELVSATGGKVIQLESFLETYVPLRKVMDDTGPEKPKKVLYTKGKWYKSPLVTVTFAIGFAGAWILLNKLLI
ncbi:MAG: vWA domain-containing protein [Bacteroidota bacterium]